MLSLLSPSSLTREGNYQFALRRHVKRSKRARPVEPLQDVLEIIEEFPGRADPALGRGDEARTQQRPHGRRDANRQIIWIVLAAQQGKQAARGHKQVGGRSGRLPGVYFWRIVGGVRLGFAKQARGAD